jgi:large subunit ribosomal protein L22
MDTKKGYAAHAKYLFIAPSKVRPIADAVREKPYTVAMAILDTLPNKGADMLKKVLKSAASNALYQNKNLDEEMLFIKELLVNDGPRMKRIWPRGRGRRDILLKRMSHISVVVDEIARMGA